MGIIDAFRSGTREGYARGRRVPPRRTMDWDIVVKMVEELMETGRFSYLSVRSVDHTIERGQLDRVRHYATNTSGPYTYIVQCREKHDDLVSNMTAQQLHRTLANW